MFSSREKSNRGRIFLRLHEIGSFVFFRQPFVLIMKKVLALAYFCCNLPYSRFSHNFFEVVARSCAALLLPTLSLVLLHCDDHFLHTSSGNGWKFRWNEDIVIEYYAEILIILLILEFLPIFALNASNQLSLTNFDHFNDILKKYYMEVYKMFVYNLFIFFLMFSILCFFSFIYFFYIFSHSKLNFFINYFHIFFLFLLCITFNFYFLHISLHFIINFLIFWYFLTWYWIYHYWMFV